MDVHRFGVIFPAFCFFNDQRYIHYALLSHLFFIFAFISLLNEIFKEKNKTLTSLIIILITYTLIYSSIDNPVRYFSKNPRGADQKSQISFLKDYDFKNPKVNNYCFFFYLNEVNIIPAEWWFVSFGDAYRYFVNPLKKFDLDSKIKNCDAKFIFEPNGDLMEIPITE